MSKKFWLIILILFAILAGAFYWYFNYSPAGVSPTESQKEKIEQEKSFETIELEKPPFLK